MKILIIGASGYIGKHLVDDLLSHQYQVVVSSRNPERAKAVLGNRPEYIEWDGKTAEQLSPHLNTIDGIVNLAGENIGALKRWTPRWKKTLNDSRVQTGLALAKAMLESKKMPGILIQGSASGIYGTEANQPAGEMRELGTGFLAELTKYWERSVGVLEDKSVRLVYLRTGVVLGKSSAFLSRILLSFRFGMGVIPGGKQWVSWIHINDVTASIKFLLENPKANGPFNLTAPDPITMRQLVKAIAQVKKLPAWITIPPFMLKLILGEMAKETILSSQDILPEALLDAGYSFKFSTIEDALTNILEKK